MAGTARDAAGAGADEGAGGGGCGCGRGQSAWDGSVRVWPDCVGTCGYLWVFVGTASNRGDLRPCQFTPQSLPPVLRWTAVISGMSTRFDRGHWQGVQHVGMLGVPTLHAGVAQDPGGPVPELEKADRGIAAIVEVPDPGTDRPVAGPVMKVMLLVGVGIHQVAVPGLEARAVDPVDPVDARWVELDVCQVLARVPGQRGVGVEVNDPVIDLEMSQADVDRQALGKLLAAALEVRAERGPYSVALAHRDRAGVTLGRDDHPIVEERLVDPDGLLQEVVVVETHRNCFNPHLPERGVAPCSVVTALSGPL